MARPTEIFRGKAPAAMARMGEGIADAYTNVGRTLAETGKIEGQGYAKLGEAIGSLAQGIGGAYGNYKQMASSVKASEGFYQTMKDNKLLPDKLTGAIDQTIGSEAYKNMGTYEKSQYWGNVQQYTGNAIQQQFAMDQINANQSAATGRTAMQEAGATARNQVNADVSRDSTLMNFFGTSMNNPTMGALQRSTVLSGDDPVRIQLAPTGGGYYRPR